VENIMKALEGVEDWKVVAGWLGTYLGSSSSLQEAVERFIHGQGHFQPSWRAMIFALDGTGDIPVANCIRSYGEPVQGRYTHLHKKYIHTRHATACVPSQ
jgi:hypothetical protein